MNSVERVKAICKERKIPISRLEKDCGFANGYIGQLRKGVFPDNRLVTISEYLDVSIEFLMTGELQKETSAQDVDERREVSDKDLMFALWGDTAEVSDADLEDVKRYAAFVAERKKKRE